MSPTLVGPAWTATGKSPVDAGRFPLGVETATLANAAQLVPGVNSGTAHARYYSLHAFVATVDPATSGAPENLTRARNLVRRAEVLTAAASLRHAKVAPEEHHGAIGLREPHGALVIGRAMEHKYLDLRDLAAQYSRQTGGFLAVYRGAEITLGLLDGAAGTLAPGPVQLPPAATIPLKRLVSLAANDQVPIASLEQLLPDACICSVRTGPDGLQIRRLLFGGPGAPAAPDPVRHARAWTARSARLLVAALSGRPVSTSPDDAMADLCCFTDLESAVPDEQMRAWALYWRGAILRNASVTAWRKLWWWLTEQLRHDPRSAADLGRALSDALVGAAGSDRPARSHLLESLPLRRSADGLLRDAESDILYPAGQASDAPLDLLRCLALGAQRLDDLDGQARQSFCRPGELGPFWVRRWLDELGSQTLSEVGRTLTGVLLRQAEELSRHRARWEHGQLRLPTRLRQVGDVLDLAGEEGHTTAGLRLGRLAQILGELDVLSASNDAFCRGSASEWTW